MKLNAIPVENLMQQKLLLCSLGYVGLTPRPTASFDWCYPLLMNSTEKYW